jgi:hypothetical protein
MEGVQNVSESTPEAQVKALSIVGYEAKSSLAQEVMEIEKAGVWHLGIRGEHAFRVDIANLSSAKSPTHTSQYRKFKTLNKMKWEPVQTNRSLLKGTPLTIDRPSARI